MLVRGLVVVVCLCAVVIEGAGESGSWINKFQNILFGKNAGIKKPIQPSVPELVSLAQQKIAEGNITQSVDILLNALSIDATHQEGNALLGGIMLSMQKYDIAEDFLFAAASASNWTDTSSIYNLAMSMKQRGALLDGLSVLHKGLAAVDNQDATGALNYGIGELLLSSGNYSLAADWFLSAAVIRKTDVPLWIKASTVRFPSAGFDYVFAQNVLAAAVKEVPQNSDLYFHLGMAAHLVGRLKEAVLLYEVSLDFNANNYDSISSIATILHSNNQFEDALPWYVRAERLEPNNVVLLSNIAMLLESLGDRPLAQKYAKKAVELDSSNADAVRAYNLVHSIQA